MRRGPSMLTSSYSFRSEIECVCVRVCVHVWMLSQTTLTFCRLIDLVSKQYTKAIEKKIMGTSPVEIKAKRAVRAQTYGC